MDIKKQQSTEEDIYENAEDIVEDDEEMDFFQAH
jgi:hypothetical protein